MHSNRVLRATILSMIVLLSSLLPLIIFNPTVSADPTGGTTTLYFHDFLESDGFMDGNKPTKVNDSEWPPRIWDSENWLLWASFLITSLVLDNESEFELDAFSSLFLDPYTVWGTYEYGENNTLRINGDVVFDVFIKSPIISKIKRNDIVQVSIFWLDLESLLDFNFEDVESELDFFEEINTNYTLKPNIPSNNINNYEITIENFNLTLIPGSMLIFAIKVIPGVKPLGRALTFDGPLSSIRKNILPGFKKDLLNWIMNKGNSSKINIIKSLSEALILVKDILESQNITKQDFKEIINGLRSSSIVYDSVNHPSSVIVPFVSSENTENNYVYYLHNENEMTEEKPTGGNFSIINLYDGLVQWASPLLERNKILIDATAKLYIDHQNIYRFLNLLQGKVKITAKLLKNATELGSVEKTLSKTTLLNLLDKPEIPFKFTFEIEPNEIQYGENLYLEVSASNGPKINILSLFGIRKSAKLLFGSAEYPSSLSLKFNDTKHITIDVTADPNDELIVPGGSVKYDINISSKFDDEISVDVNEDISNDWDVTILDDKIDIKAGKTVETSVFINSTKNKKSAYGDSIDLTITVAGKTGIARKKASVEISEDAIDYDVNIIEYTKSKSIKQGKSGTFYFIIKNNNTGAIDDVDSYLIDATSQNDWETKYTESIDNLGIGKKIGVENEILLVVSVPKNTSKKADTITFTVTSVNNPNTFAVVNVTIEVIGPTLLESVYEFFESASNSIGLDDIFGSYGPHALAASIIIIILFIIIILIFLITRKIVNIICTDRIKEIDPNDKATFKIEIENPSKKNRTYELHIADNPSNKNWIKSIDTNKIEVESHKSRTVLLTIEPTDTINPKDWTETKIKLKVARGRKTEEISTMTIIKDGKTLLKISDVFTWPKEIIPGKRIITSFKLFNKGNITARNVAVKLFINGKEKNKTEVTIPSTGYADIRIPWIANKGKNKLLIKAIEQ